MKIFISYSANDKAIAKQIATTLIDNCFNVWLDEWEIKVGESIVQKVQEGLMESKYVCVILSKKSIASGWVEKEWQSKIGIEAKTRNVHILPLLIEDCKIPVLLLGKKYADFRHDYQKGMSELLQSFELNTKAINNEKTISEKRRAFQINYRLVFFFTIFLCVSFFVWQAIIKPRPTPYIFKGNNQKEILTQTHIIVPPNESYRIHEVLQLKDLDYSSFELIEEQRVVDFRGWKPFIKNDQHKISPVTWSRKLRLKKIKDEDNIRLQIGTEGVAIDAKVIGSDDYWIEAAISPTLPRQLILNTIQVVINIKKYKVGETFELEIQATLWNGSNYDEDWTAVCFHQPIKLYSFLLIFSKEKPYFSRKFVMYEPGSTEELSPSSTKNTVLTSPDNQILFWELENPIPQNIYEIQWTW